MVQSDCANMQQCRLTCKDKADLGDELQAHYALSLDPVTDLKPAAWSVSGIATRPRPNLRLDGPDTALVPS